MANSDHLRILKRGVKAWNQWRNENPEIQPDLVSANLGGAHLKYRLDAWPANLPASAWPNDAIFENCDLRGLNLRKAKLDGTFIGQIDLRGGSLSGAEGKNVDLRESDLRGVDFSYAGLEHSNFSGTDLRNAIFNKWSYFPASSFTNANLVGVRLTEAFLEKADIAGAHLDRAHLKRANLHGSKLIGACLVQANLDHCDLSAADLTQATLRNARVRGADLSRAILVETDLQGADLTGATIYGISAWNLKVQGAIQSNLVITAQDRDEPIITVDNLEIGQFIYLLLNNEKIRGVIDTITSKVVLILGRFTPDRKALLEALRDELRKADYLPVLFDFKKSASRDLTESVSTLAHMARFVIADITDAKSIPQELERIIPDLPSVPVQPLIQASRQEYGMFEHFHRYPWVLEPVAYHNELELLGKLRSEVIAPAEAKAKEQTSR